MARLAAGESVRTVAVALSIGASSVVKGARRLRVTGSAAPGRIGGYVAPKTCGEHKDLPMERTRAAPFSLRGVVWEMARRGLKVDDRTMWKFVRREGLSSKNPAGQRARQARRGPQAGARWKTCQG